MAKNEKNGGVLELDDNAVFRGKATPRGARIASLTKLLGVTLMLLMLLVLVYVGYLHVRLTKLEQCQCIVDSTRTWADNVDDELIDKVRMSLSDCGGHPKSTSEAVISMQVSYSYWCSNCGLHCVAELLHEPWSQVRYNCKKSIRVCEFATSFLPFVYDLRANSCRSS